MDVWVWEIYSAITMALNDNPMDWAREIDISFLINGRNDFVIILNLLVEYNLATYTKDSSIFVIPLYTASYTIGIIRRVVTSIGENVRSPNPFWPNIIRIISIIEAIGSALIIFIIGEIK